MKTVKVLTEELEILKIEAKAIVQAADSAGRELTDDENSRFDQITKVAIVEKNQELTRAKDIEREVIALSAREDRQRRISALDAEPERSRMRVLPTNGEVANDEDGQEPRVYHRMAKLKAFKDEKTAFHCGMWLRAMYSRIYNRDDRSANAYITRLGWPVTNAATEGTGGGGGYLVPSPLAQTIIDVRETVGVARRILNIQPMTADTLTISRRAGGLTVYYPGETIAINLSDGSWQQIELIVKKRSVATQISQELQDDALISVVDDAVSEISYALAEKEDAETINGDGTSAYGGVMGLLSSLGAAGVVSAASGHDTWGELDVADFTSAMGRLPDKYTRDTSWVCSSNFYWTAMAKVLLSGGGNSIADLQAGTNGAQFFGRPVYFTDKMPRVTATSTKSALYGTFSMGAILGDRTGIAVGRSEDYQFLQDMTTLKASTRYDIKVHAGGDANTVGAYVALATAS